MSGGDGGGHVFVLEVPDYKSAMLIYLYIYELLAHLEARRLWRGIMIHNFVARFPRCAFGTPKDNGVDASIDIFLVSSLEYHLI